MKTEYKELELRVDGDRNYANMKTAEIGNKYAFKLHAYDRVMSKTVTMNNGRTFEANNLGCMHAGKEVMLSLTQNMKNSFEKLGLKVGDTFEVNVVENKKSTYTNKAYYLNAFAPGVTVENDKEKAKEIKAIIKDKGFDFKAIDLYVVGETLHEMGADRTDMGTVYLELAQMMQNED